MELTYQQKRSLLEEGYVKVTGVIPKIMVDRALRHINHSIGEGINVSDIPIFRARSYCPELQGEAPVSDLYNKTAVKDLVESLIGSGLAKPVRSGQIALRFPSLQDPPNDPRPHLDGMHTKTNGVPEGKINNFTLLVGVLLSPVRGTNEGNFTVWPGTHHRYEQYFREHGPDSLLNGMPPIPLSAPIQTTGEPGDVFLVHYQLAHGVAPNVSPFPRYAVFFRVSHIDHEKDWRAPMTDIWLHWPGIRELEPK
ncbi:hypothetical protein O9H85_23245 [Paenibacillus filicis]|uniref:Phytanoyl-CoA dioxygenase n=1 Tax=Paenibacillus gyeongsangnamensis TaxID=3388067 RepID=A0ABT4QEG7_9BACL|nr:hypothetical protein [Paenibacillus filicis]MCZ8515276.1 hypothetical protein [Paenibacillus filicis]